MRPPASATKLLRMRRLEGQLGLIHALPIYLASAHISLTVAPRRVVVKVREILDTAGPISP